MARTREERLRIVASGKCRSVTRSFGDRVKYLPSIAGIVGQISEEEEDCYRTSKEAVKAAETFRDIARSKLAEEFG